MPWPPGPRTPHPQPEGCLLDRPAGIIPACIPLREDPSDWLVMRPDAPEDMVIGTSAVRRERVLSQIFPRAASRGSAATCRRDSSGCATACSATNPSTPPCSRRRAEAAGLDLTGLTSGPSRLASCHRPLGRARCSPRPGPTAPISSRCCRIARCHDRPVRSPGTSGAGGIGGGCQQPLEPWRRPRRTEACCCRQPMHRRASFAGPRPAERTTSNCWQRS